MSKLIKLITSILIGTLLLCLIATSNASPLDVSQENLESTTTLAPSTTTKKPLPECSEGGVCGWAVYDKASNNKKTKYFLRNTCKCNSTMRCLFSKDDLSLGAFVYKCLRDEDSGKV